MFFLFFLLRDLTDLPAAATHYFQQGSQVMNEGKSENSAGRGIGQGFITYIIISVVVSVALLRLMGDVLVSCRFRSDSGAPGKFILYRFLFFSVRNTMCGL